MIVVRAAISATVDLPTSYANTVEEAEQQLAELIREQLGRIGNVRTTVEVTLRLDSVEQLRDQDVPGYIDYDGRYE
ncbi:hypothetical protein Nigel_49 [Mycobacterium phage Nigel]|uniref:Uncharacterized protein n=1 Tax=Mycobacterium phage Nigel TaxID=543152 RepID=B3VLX8_9CAUD|nr:gp49 [Mycobacterium phage Nigel]ACF05052.1 hypothetical protein Nigel_49 [Mycobacterium phage Nigel]